MHIIKDKLNKQSLRNCIILINKMSLFGMKLLKAEGGVTLNALVAGQETKHHNNQVRSMNLHLCTCSGQKKASLGERKQSWVPVDYFLTGQPENLKSFTSLTRLD